MISYTVVIASSGKRDLISFFCLNLAPHLPFPSFVPLAFTTRLAVLEEWAVIRLWSPAVPDLPWPSHTISTCLEVVVGDAVVAGGHGAGIGVGAGRIVVVGIQSMALVQ